MLGSALALAWVSTSLASASPAPPSPYDSAPPNRVTWQVDASLGLFPGLGSSLAYERRAYHDLGVLIRGGTAVVASLLETEAGPDTVNLFYVNLGLRYYFGRFYMTLESGVSVIRRPAYNDSSRGDTVEVPLAYKPRLSEAMGIGWKLGVVDIGVSVVYPQAGIQGHVGVDLGRF